MPHKLATKLLLKDLSKLTKDERRYIENMASMTRGHTPGNLERLKNIARKHNLIRESKEDFSALGGKSKKS